MFSVHYEIKPIKLSFNKYVMVLQTMKTYERRRPIQKFHQNCTRFASVCRLCLSDCVDKRYIFDSTDDVPLPIKIMACASVEVHEGDGLPTEVCGKCITKLETFYKFRQRCGEADSKLRDIAKQSKNVQVSELHHSRDEHFVPPASQSCEDIEKLSESICKSNRSIDASSSTGEGNSLLPNSSIVVNERNSEWSETDVCVVKTSTFDAKENLTSNMCLNERNGDNSFYSSMQQVENCENSSFLSISIGSTNAKVLHINTEPSSGDLDGSSGSDKVNKVQRIGNLYLFICEKCPKGFSRRIDLKRHSSVHDQQRGFVCGVCEKWFPDKTNYKRHERIHTGERPFCCSYCQKCFSQESILSRHLMTHRKEKPFKCDVCAKEFTQKEGLKIHLRHHSNQEIQRHFCPLCEKAFCHQSGLSRHLIAHTGKTFDCHVCSKSFSDQSSLKRHSKRHIIDIKNEGTSSVTE